MKVSVSQVFVPVLGKKRWVVSWTPAGQSRQRRYLKTKELAEAHASSIRLQHQQAGEVWLSLSAQDRNEVIAVHAEVVAKGLSLRDVWEKFKLGKSARPVITKPIGKVIAEVVTAKRAANRRERYLKHLETCLGCFAKGREEMPLSDFTAEGIEAWLAERKYKPSARATLISRLSTLFSFAKRRGYVAENPCDAIEGVSEDKAPPSILTLRQAAKALIWTKRDEPEFLAWLALALLAGLRPEEADKVEWAAIDLDRATVKIDSAASKIRARRIVHLMPAAAAWLRLAKEVGARLPLPYSTRRKYLRRLRDRLGFKAWPADVLRHTAASYWLAEWQDAGKVALELGNSVGVLLRNYRELVMRETAKKFWAITPERLRSVRKIVEQIR